MNLKQFSLLLLSLELFAASSGVYLEVGAGIGTQDKLSTKSADYIYDRGYTGTLALGYQADMFRYELEGIYKQDELYSSTNGSLGSSSVNGDMTKESQMLNVYISGYNQSKLISTIGFGVGTTTISLKDLVKFGTPQQDIKNKNIFSYQGILGVGYMINKNITILTKYRYFKTQESDNFKSNSDNIFSINLRYLF